MKTPDITPAQVIVIVKSVVAVAVAFGLSLSGDQQTAVIALVGLLVPAAFLLLADTKIRGNRAKVEEAKVIAKGK